VFFYINTYYMQELHFIYDFTTFTGKPKRDVEKIDECKLLDYNVDKDIVTLKVICDCEATADKLKQYFAIRYEILPKLQKTIS
jgi:hypothetical protein